MSYTDLSGRVFGYLTVIRREGADNTGKNSTWLCKCKCGNYTVVSRVYLTRKYTVSCGCRQYESKNFTHGMSKTRIYHEWLSMKRRCSRAQEKDYKHYEGRGISVCEEWNSDFEKFMDWALANGYTDDLSLDRIDVNKGYYPENCRWITIEDQQSNKQNTIHVEYNGKDWCLRTLCRHIGFPYKTAHCRYRRLKKRGAKITAEELFKPIAKEKVSYRFRETQ